MTTASANRYADEISELTQERLRLYFETRKTWNVAKQLTSVTEQFAEEYGGRALIELLQNGHDVQPASGGGRLRIVLDTAETTLGRLYVANTGRPFLSSNFRAICDLAASDKPKNEGIGNKGIGFKSVLQICRNPEVFSAVEHSTSRTFDGYCFRFAKSDDVLALVGDRDRAKLVEDELSPLFLPVPIEHERDPLLDELRESGFVTVVRCDLDSATALQATEEQLEQIEADDPPLMLFLERLAEIQIDRVETNKTTSATLRRRFEQIRPLPHWVSKVETSSGQSFVLGFREVAEAQVQKAIAQGIEQRALDSSWVSWQGNTRVAVAIPLSGNPGRGVLYTFLPMSQEAPFAGHAHAPFFTRLARLDLNEANPLNHLLLNEIAALCADLARSIASSGNPTYRKTLVDLLTWGDSWIERLKRAFERTGGDLATEPLIPIHGGRFASLSTVRLLTGAQPGVLTPQFLSKRLNVPLVEAGLGDCRRSEIKRLAIAVCGQILTPTPDEIAEWAERSASYFAARKSFSAKLWGGFYDDLALLLDGRDKSLRGRQIILDSEGKLKRGESPTEAERLATTVFFAPVRGEDTDDVPESTKIPASLSRRIAFTHPGIEWNLRKGRTQAKRPGRKLLEEGLVREYRTAQVVDVISRISRLSKTEQAKADALRFVFQLARRAVDKPDLSEIDLSVPTVGRGWIPARRAIFSSEWGSEEACVLQTLLETAHSDELTVLAQHRLTDPSGPPFRGDVDAWRIFLEELGVTHGLRPVEAAGTIRRSGQSMTAATLRTSVTIGAANFERWKSDVSLTRTPSNPYLNYEFETPLLKLPGQDDYETFGEGERLLYARLIAQGLTSWAPTAFASILTHADRRLGRDKIAWPTPVSSFIRHAEWIPMTEPGSRRKIGAFALPADCWYHSGLDEAPPSFAPVVATDVRKIVRDNEAVLKILKDHGLRIWDDPEFAADLVQHLGDLAAERVLPVTVLASFRKTYERAWEDALDGDCDDLFSNDEDRLVVTEGEAVRAFSVRELRDSPFPVTVVNVDAPVKLHALHSAHRRLIRMRPQIGAGVYALLARKIAGAVRAVSEVTVEVHLDGKELSIGAGQHLVDEDHRWLPTLIATVAELKSGPFVTRTQASLQRLTERLRQIKLHQGQDLRLLVDGSSVSVPPQLRGAFPVDDGKHLAIAFATNLAADAEWERLEALSPALCELLALTDVTESLQLAIKRLAERHLHPGDVQLPDADLASLLSETEERVREVRTSFASPLQELLYFLYPLAVLQTGAAESSRLDPADPRVTNRGEIEDALHELELPWPAARLMTLAERGEGIHLAVTELGVDLTALNATLRLLGSPFAPIDNGENQQRAFAVFLDAVEGRVQDRLRERFLDRFRQRADLGDYLAARRSFASLQPEASWRQDQWALPRELLDSYLARFLTTHGADPDLIRVSPLQALSMVTTENISQATGLIEKARVTIIAWCRKHDSPIPPAWATCDSATQVVPQLQGGGRFDFIAFDEAEMLVELAQTGGWPTGMPCSVSLPELGLTEDDIAASTSGGSSPGPVRTVRTVTIDGEKFPTEDLDYRAIMAAVESGITQTFLKAAKSVAALPEPPPASGVKKAKNSAAGRRSEAPRRLTEGEKDAIGFAGEIAAMKWLAAQYPGFSPDSSWRSTYRKVMFPDEPGDDSLGYDFIVRQASGDLFFEVKATTGDLAEFELGESEVRMAQEHARNGRFRVLYVTRVLDGADRSITVLPNPFGSTSRDRFRLVGEGVRLRFTLPSAD